MIDWWELISLTVTAGLANMVPPIAAKIFPKWNTPLDMGMSMEGLRVLGDHKTMRGLAAGIVVGQIIFFFFKIDYVPWYFGGLLGLGALGGDTVESFIKRRAKIPSGTSWFPWDQIDWIIGFTLVASIWNLVNIWEFGILILTGLVLHMIFKVLGYILKFNKELI